MNVEKVIITAIMALGLAGGAALAITGSGSIDRARAGGAADSELLDTQPPGMPLPNHALDALDRMLAV